MHAFYNYMLVASFLLLGPERVYTRYYFEPVVYQAELGQFPYHVDLKSLPTPNDKNYSVFCAGALIGTNKVLTLPSCLVKGGISDGNDTKRLIDVTGIYVVASTLRRYETFEENSDSQWRQIASILLSKDLVVAIAYTCKHFVLNEYVDTIPYASQYMEGNGERCVLAGYAVRLGDGKSDNLTYGNLTSISENEFSVDGIDSNKTMYAKYGPGARKYPGSALVCFNTSDPNEGPRGVMAGMCIGHEWQGKSDFIRLSYYYDFVNNTSTNIKEIVFKYCLLVTLCEKLFMT